MKNFRKIKKSMCFIVAVCLSMCLFSGTIVYAYTTSTSGYTTISPSTSDFNNAKSPMYIKQSQSISGKIASSYKMDVYHYECQKSGYYQIYTTGSKLDTIGAVYEEENPLFSSAKYERRAYNDTGKITISDNCSMVVDMDKYEDYYVCLRGYASRIGSYTLKIEPNQDKTWYRNYGVWKYKEMSNEAARLGVWTTRKVYLNEEQALACFLALDGWDFEYNGSYYEINELQKLYVGNPSLVANIMSTTVSSVIGVYDTAAGITVSIVALILTETLGAQGNLEIDLADKLEVVCGIDKKTTSAITSTGVDGSCTISNGIMMKETYCSNSSAPYTYDFYKHDGDSTAALTGEKWYYGVWTY